MSLYFFDEKIKTLRLNSTDLSVTRKIGQTFFVCFPQKYNVITVIGNFETCVLSHFSLSLIYHLPLIFMHSAFFCVKCSFLFPFHYSFLYSDSPSSKDQKYMLFVRITFHCIFLYNFKLKEKKLHGNEDATFFRNREKSYSIIEK